MSADSQVRPRRSAAPRLRAASLPSGPALGAIAVTVAFLVITCWWLAVDRSVQYSDAAQDVLVTLQFRELLSHWQIADAIDLPNYYPPSMFTLGALAMFVGGKSVAVPVLAQNLVYVPLLALGCYQVGRRLAGPTAGLLAVVFALGAPLIIEQFHVFMLDAPQGALVAVTVWLVLASERFSRIPVCVLAGAALGVGVETKELAPLYVVGLVVAVLARGGGWRNWRGLLAFAAAAFVVGSPWYIAHHDQLGDLLHAAGRSETVPVAAKPATLSLDNLLWFFWATLNGLLFAPLFAFASVGVVAAAVRSARARPLEDPTFELLVGLIAAWAVLTFVMAHHDLRYTMGLLVFLSTLGTAWIVRLRAPARAAAIALLVAAVVTAHVGATLGVGGATERLLPGNRQATLGEGVPLTGQVVVYSNHNFLVSGPKETGDMLALFRALRASGARGVYWRDAVDEADPVFERIGLLVFAEIAGLENDYLATDFTRLRRDDAVAIRAIVLDGTPPCLLLSDGTGVWVRFGDPDAPGARNACPL